MNDFFLVKWYRTNCFGKILSVVFVLFLCCICGSVPSLLYSFFGDYAGFSKNTLIPTVTKQINALVEEPTTMPMKTPTAEEILSRDDYEVVCRGEAIEEAPAYEPEEGSGKTHPAIAFLFYPDSENVRPFTLSDNFSNIEIVACLNRINERLRDKCYYTMSDTGERHVVYRYDATYKMQVYEAQSGKKLGESVIEKIYTGKCLPEFSTFSLKTEHYWYADPSEIDIEANLQIYINP